MRVAAHLKRPTREPCGPHARPKGLGPPAPLFGLAPGGVCRATECCHRRGALLPHPFTLTGPTTEVRGLRRFAFCCTFRGLAPPRRYLAPCPWSPDFPPRLRAAVVWPTPARDGGGCVAAECKRYSSWLVGLPGAAAGFVQLGAFRAGQFAQRFARPATAATLRAKRAALVQRSTSAAASASEAAARAPTIDHDLAARHVRHRAAPLLAQALRACRCRRFRIAWSARGSRGACARAPNTVHHVVAVPPAIDAALRRTPACVFSGASARVARGARRAFAGKKPSKAKRSVGRPAIDSAAMAAHGPGIATTGMPRCRAAATRSKPGSLIERRARVGHQRDRFTGGQARDQLVALLRLVVLVQRRQRRSMPQRLQQLPRVPRIFCGDQIARSASTSRARGLRSPRLPIGVATTYSVPRCACRGLPIRRSCAATLLMPADCPGNAAMPTADVPLEHSEMPGRFRRSGSVR